MCICLNSYLKSFLFILQDEKAVKKCNLLLLAAIDERKKLIQSVNLELKFLKGGVREMRKEVIYFY